MLTKVLCYSELYGRLSEKGKTDKKIQNVILSGVEGITNNAVTLSLSKGKTEFPIEGRNLVNSTPNISYNFQMPYDDAEKYFSNLGIIDAPAFYEDLNKYAGQAFTISYITKSETLLGVKNFLTAQLGTGEVDPKLLAEKIQEYAVKNGDDALHPWHLQTVVRTNLQTAFAKGRYKEQLDGDDPYWQYFATVDGRETPLCHSLDDKVFRKEDPFWKQNYPPNHFNCRSTVVTLDEDTLEEEGLNVENDGSKYLEQMQKKYPDKNFDAGKGFNLAPDRGLSKWLKKKCKEHKIENVEDKVPEFKTRDEALNYHANMILDKSQSKYEIATVFNMNDFKFAKGGEKSSVSFTREEVKLCEGMTFMHNHPRSSSFSDADIYMMLNSKCKEMIAVSPANPALGSNFFIMENKSNNRNITQKINLLQSIYSEKENEVRDDLIKKIKDDKISETEGIAIFYHKVWEEVVNDERIDFLKYYLKPFTKGDK